MAGFTELAVLKEIDQHLRTLPKKLFRGSTCLQVKKKLWHTALETH